MRITCCTQIVLSHNLPNSYYLFCVRQKQCQRRGIHAQASGRPDQVRRRLSHADGDFGHPTRGREARTARGRGQRLLVHRLLGEALVAHQHSRLQHRQSDRRALHHVQHSHGWSPTVLAALQRIRGAARRAEARIWWLLLSEASGQMAVPVERTAAGRAPPWSRTVFGEGVRGARDRRERRGARVSHRLGGRCVRVAGRHQGDAARPRGGHGVGAQVGQRAGGVGFAGATRESDVVHAAVFLFVRDCRV